MAEGGEFGRIPRRIHAEVERDLRARFPCGLGDKRIAQVAIPLLASAAAIGPCKNPPWAKSLPGRGAGIHRAPHK
jgi:hypothetical protein